MSIEEIIEELQNHASWLEMIGGRDAQKELKAVNAAIALLRTHPEAQPNEPQEDWWISVKDTKKPPQEGKKVLACLDLGGGDPVIDMAYYMGEDGWYYVSFEAPHHGIVTYWSPLPEPPKED